MVMENESPGCDSNSDPGVIGKKSTEYLGKACQNILLRLLPLMQLCWQYMKMHSGATRLSNWLPSRQSWYVTSFPRVNAKAAGILSECRPQPVAEECEYATVDMLPELFVSPPR